MNTEAVLFDLDGTLVDSLPLIVRTYRHVFKEMDIPWGNDDVVKMIGLPLKDIGRRFVGEAAPAFEERYQYYYHRDHDLYTRLFPGTLEMLESLKSQGIRLGIVTSKGKPGTTRTAAFTRLDGYMDVMITAHDVARHKPDPEPILTALATLHAQAERTIFIGDSSYDILTGKNAGCLTLGVAWGLDSRTELEKLSPDGILASWEELQEYL
ncbi:Pyrophosphatase PpaX [Pelotomaculum sp. FP]|uniref:HAD family hydrolase n=1 Tax=Pelotomaculum sp. FP TaxID=261474 RepID=UPI001064EF75|nr:HAD-IA family hydrolase [Pelotomaculum sp. FP]TEB15951.1 Pyrophosphatase PpaX [Pelotomaculum sp. FP]